MSEKREKVKMVGRPRGGKWQKRGGLVEERDPYLHLASFNEACDRFLRAHEPDFMARQLEYGRRDARWGRRYAADGMADGEADLTFDGEGEL